MKKYIQIIVVLALVLTIVGIARTNPAWASALPRSVQSSPTGVMGLAGPSFSQPSSIVVTGSGDYLVGGVCQFNATYISSDLKDEVDAEVPIKESKAVPFSYEGDLFYPGCHVVHYLQDKVVSQVTSDEGNWKVCFGKRPDIQMKIYYYQDKPKGGSPIWISLPTTVEGKYACAPALVTGVYMPAGKVDNQPGDIGAAVLSAPAVPIQAGTVLAPAVSETGISRSGTYSVGGICSERIVYGTNNLSDSLVVELPVEDNQVVSFPNNGDLLYFPGCHALHYERSLVQKQMANTQGVWEICFAAHPDVKMTVYYYESLVHSDEQGNIVPPWHALPTTTKDGMACAPSMETGVYVPAGQ
jgi:hypothetical protein